MGAGFQLFSPSGVSIDSEKMSGRLIAYGTAYNTTTTQTGSGPVHTPNYIGMPAPALPNDTVPLLLFRPRPDAYIFEASSAGYGLGLGPNHISEYAIASDIGPPITHGYGSGMELYDGNGQLTFSTNHRHPKILQIISCPLSAFANYIPGVFGQDRLYAQFNLVSTPDGSRPWILSSDLVTASWANSGALGDYTPSSGHSYGFRLPSANILQVEVFAEGYNGSISDSRGIVRALIDSGSPFGNRPLRIAVCYIPGY